MSERILVDTDVLIDFLRNNPFSIAFIKENLENVMVSGISVVELYAGVRDGYEMKILSRFMNIFDFIPVNKEISVKGGLIKRDYGKRNGLSLADAIIAATSSIYGCKLATLNLKHFKMFDNVFAPYSK